MFFDYYYLILVVPAIIVSFFAQSKVKSTYAKMSKISNKKRISGSKAAQDILYYSGLSNVVKVEPVKGELTDHYDPRANVVRLSSKVYNGTSIASIGIACHEVGHAIQYANNYIPIKIRNFLLPIVNFGSSSGFLIAIIGYFMGAELIVNIGILLFACVALFQLITLPIEFNASRRAIKLISEKGLLYDEELPYAKKVLSAAAMTYVAALLVSVMSLLRLFLRTRRNNN